MKTFPCFGLEFLGQCGYNPLNPTVYFSIGQLLSLIIIALAVYKILDPIIKLRIKANRLFKFKIFHVSALFSIIAIFFSNLIPSIPDFYKIPVIGYPIFWESLSGLILICLTISFIRIISKPALLNKYNCKDFFNSALSIIDQREEKELILLARELTNSLNIIITVANKYEQFYSHIQNLAQKKYAPNENPISISKLNQLIQKDKNLQKTIQLDEFQNYCFKIMDLLSDKVFCEIVSCKVPEFSEKFFSILSFSYNFPEQEKVFGNILKSSFEKENSILNRENQDDGLKIVNNLTSIVFENQKLLQQRPFYSITSSIEPVKFTKEWQIKLYFSCLKVALKFSFDVKCHQTLKNIHDGVLNIQNVLNNILYSQLPSKKEIDLFHYISIEMSSMLYILYENKGQIKTYSSYSHLLFPTGFHSNNKNRHEVSLYDVLAKSIFDLILTLSQINSKNSNEELLVRLAGVSLLMSVLQGSYKQSKEISKILLSYIEFHIDEENFKNRAYPALTKYMIIVFGLYYPHKKKTEWDFLKCYLLDKLKKEFHSLYLLEKEFALNLLPFSVSYDSKKKIMTQVITSRFEKNRTLQCE